MADPVLVTGKWRHCDGCETEPPEGAPLVQVGQAPDYESSTAQLCFLCLKKAVDVLTDPALLAPGEAKR